MIDISPLSDNYFQHSYISFQILLKIYLLFFCKFSLRISLRTYIKQDGNNIIVFQYML